MLKFKEDGKCSRWDELWSHSYFYNEKCDGCDYIVEIEGRKFCGKCEGRVAEHQVIRSQIGCHYCDNYTKKLTSAVCRKCLREHPNAKTFKMFEELNLKEKYLEKYGTKK